MLTTFHPFSHRVHPDHREDFLEWWEDVGGGGFTRGLLLLSTASGWCWREVELLPGPFLETGSIAEGPPRVSLEGIRGPTVLERWWFPGLEFVGAN